MKTMPDNGEGWVMRMRSGALSTAERAAIQRWLEAAAEHSRDLLRAETAWRLSGALESQPEVQHELAQLDELRTRHAAARSKKRTVWISLAAAAGLATAAVIAWSTLQPTHRYETARGEQRMVTLPDGSTVAINTDTSLTIDIATDRREIRLIRGEALFQVTHDPQRPFVVHAGAGSTRVLGTRFNVLAQDGGAVVSVLEGRVELQPENATQEKRLLSAGQSAAYTANGALVTPEPTQASPERISAWREGKLRFDAWPLDRAVREYNRYTPKPIRLQVEPEANIRISGVFRIGDSTTFVKALGELVGAKVVERNGELLLQSPQPAPADQWK